jgi:AAT family amino acid transporter
VFGLVILAAIFTVGFIGEDSRPQLLRTFGLVAVLAAANWLHHRSIKRSATAPGSVESTERVEPPVLVD